MTIQEAIKSGKPFKRPLDGMYVEPRPDGVISDFDGEPQFFAAEDILANDWEVKSDA